MTQDMFIVGVEKTMYGTVYWLGGKDKIKEFGVIFPGQDSKECEILVNCIIMTLGTMNEETEPATP